MPTFDRDALNRLTNYDQQRFNKYSAMFLTAAREDLAKIAAALRDGDIAGVGKLAHRIKGSAGMIGARRFADSCARLEEQVRRADAAAAAELLAAMLEEIEAVAEEIRLASMPAVSGEDLTT